MRKIIVLNRITLDGSFDSANGEQDWFIPGNEENQVSHEMVPPSDTLLFGRKTYEHMIRFWPTVTEESNFPQEVKIQAKEINEMPKVVFSRTLKSLTWQNCKLLTGNLIVEVTKLKQADGLGILTFGSGMITQQLLDADLIDEFVFILTPTVLVKGNPQFKQNKKIDFELVEARSFKSGNVMLHYTVKR